MAATHDPWAAYVGIPFEAHGRSRRGADCWGLHRLVLEQLAGVLVPSYGELYCSTREAEANARLLAGQMGDWLEVPEGSEQAFDGVLMRVGRHACHVATVVAPGRMLHTYAGSRSHIDNYRSGFLKERIVGFYRHAVLAGHRGGELPRSGEPAEAGAGAGGLHLS